MKFRELITENTYENLELLHTEFDLDNGATLVDLSIDSFTAQGLDKFSRILESEIIETLEKDGVMYVWLDNLSANEMEQFTSDFAGYCSTELWDTYFHTVGGV